MIRSAKAKKTGRMDADGAIFCAKDGIYQFKFYESREMYAVQDELDLLDSDEGDEPIFGHDMIPAFFNEHFCVIVPEFESESETLKDVFKMIDDIFDNLDNSIFPQGCHCDKKACSVAVKVIDDSGEKIECRLFDYSSPHLCLSDHEDVSNCPYHQYRIKPHDA
jgi:hypothetical protein